MLDIVCGAARRLKKNILNCTLEKFSENHNDLDEISYFPMRFNLKLKSSTLTVLLLKKSNPINSTCLHF